ncbi:helix-turn-helix domain-containing protein [Micromonospora fulviviridis]|uniref:Helix-turn-helix domain-containing protein n=1 Tax=Micromonospora fulviviridis TaxID=47860 RepID=A0ABV2VWX0_9ACTN
MQLLAEPDRSMSSIAKLLGVSRSTLYKALPGLVTPQLAQARLNAQLARLPAGRRSLPSVEPHDQVLSTPGK